jgi:predicted nucleotidyltransferase
MPLPGATQHKGFDDASIETLREVFADTIDTLERAGVPHLVLGGLASAVHGRPRCSADVDLFVRPVDAPAALRALHDAGFETEETNPHWLFKAWRDGVLVDLLFKAKGDIYLDDAMLARSRKHPVLGRDVRVIPPEDLVVIKALVHDEETPRHWYDAISVIASSPIDWDYLVERSRKGPRRMLALLFYAASLDLHVPHHATDRLLASVSGDVEGEERS